jgi:type I restriction enzyme S subunit
MRKEWKIKKLGEICDIIAGQSPEGKYYNKKEDGLPFYQGKKQFGEKYIRAPTTWTKFTTKEALEGDILMSVRAPVGPVNFATQRICIGRGLSAIRAGDAVDKHFLFYFLLMNKNDLEGNVGAVFDSINKTQIENIELPLPQPGEQKRIVEILDETFAVLDKAKANIEKNLQNAKELFDSYLRAAFIGKVSGELSDNLESLCDFIVDCEHKTAPTQKSGYPSIRTTNIERGFLNLENVKRVAYATFIQWTKRAIPKPGDLILAREAPAGNVAVIPENLEVCLGQRTVLIRPKKDKFISKYLTYLILSYDVQKKLLSHSKGATVQHVNMKDIREFRIYNLSTLKDQNTVVNQLDSFFDYTKKLETLYQKKINSLEKLKSSILQKAFSGELTATTQNLIT